MGGIIKRMPVSVNPVIKNGLELRESLSGVWRFRLDPDEKGLNEKWYEKPSVFSEEIHVPGCWQGQGFGSDAEDTVMDFRLAARIYKATYKGTGWYCKSFAPPEGWNGKRLWLNFGGAHPSADIWLNGIKLGEHHEPFVPFGFEITDIVKFGEDNHIVARISETGRQLGFLYSWAGNWSGLYRDVELTATEECYIKSFLIYPDVKSKSVTYKIKTGGNGGASMTADIAYGALGIVKRGESAYTRCGGITADVSNGYCEVTSAVDGPLLWSPDQPNLYRADIVLYSNGVKQDAVSDRFGFVSLTSENKKININGEPYYIRGSGDFMSSPETGCPDWDRTRWRKRLSALRAYGYNQVRCQSFVYGPEYYDAADELGVIIQGEMGMIGAVSGSSAWHTYQWPLPTAANYDALKSQWDNVVLRDVNRPSAVMYCMSNEFGIFGGGRRFKKTAWRCYNETKAMKPNSMVIWTDGGMDDEMPGDFVNDEAARDKDTALPLIQHEFRWWSSLPDVSLIDRYARGAVRHYSAEIAIKAAASHNTAHILAQGAKNSQIVQYIEAKGKMEAVRRDNPEMAGISHFNCMDTTPSPQGIINEFYEKKYADAGEWLRTNGDTVILCSLGFDDRVYKSGEQLSVTFYVSDFSHPHLDSPRIEWELMAWDRQMAAGQISYEHKPYVTVEAGRANITAPYAERPVRASLRAAVKDGPRSFENEWALWFYPDIPGITRDAAAYHAADSWLAGAGMPAVHDVFGLYTVIWSDRLDDALANHIRAGGRAVLVAGEGTTRGFGNVLGLDKGRYYFTPPANYPPYEDGQNGTILQFHPLFGDIPHQGFADLNFYRLMGESPPIELEPLELNTWDPIFRAIHKYPSSHSIGYITECKIGGGGLLICSLDLNRAYPEAAYLTKCINEYAASPQFHPGNELSREAADRLIRLTCI